MNAVANFESIAEELIRIAPTPKAAAFAARLADRIRTQGSAWIESRTNALHIYRSNEEQYFEVAANRLFFLQKWQLALAKDDAEIKARP